MKKQNMALKAITISLASLCLYGSPQQSLAGGTTIVAQAAAQPVTHLMVKLKNAVPGGLVMTAAQAASVSAIAGVALTPHRAMSDDAQVMALPAKMTYAQANAIAQKLMKNPGIQYAEPDIVVTAQVVPNDPSFALQWGYFAPTGVAPVPVAAGGANLVNAWAQTTGVLASSTVAVIDTGYLPHPDLAGKFLPGYDFITNIATANDGNGRDASALDPGDWVAGISNSSWHGTHVSGTIAAVTNNAVGVAGANWNARILPVRALGSGGGMMSDIIDGMRWAAGLAVVGVPANPVANVAKVLNMSLGGGGACGLATQTAINQVVAAGSTIVVAAGNSNINVVNSTPANCAGVIVVAANGRTGSRAPYSNFGALVTVTAPGGDMSLLASGGILSTLNAGTTIPGAYNYAYYQGTSMATPHVAGIVSLMRSVRPTLTPAQIKNILMNTARPFPAGSTCNTTICGKGIVNANDAVTASKGLRILNTSATALNFGSVTLNTTKPLTVKIVNAGLVNAAITTVTPPAGGYTTTGCAGVTLLPNAFCTLTVNFRPTLAGVKSGTIAVASNSTKAVSIAVSGTGFNAALEAFPAGGVMPVGWVNSPFDAITLLPASSAIWRVATDSFSQGAMSLKSGVIISNPLAPQNSSIQVTRTARPAGFVTFTLRVGSEPNFDFLRFYIDGVLMGAWSGAQPWVAVSYPVLAGTHTFKWSYQKDGSVDTLPDAAWIDAVVLP